MRARRSLSLLVLLSVPLTFGCNKPTEFFPLLQFAHEGGCKDPDRPQVSGFRREPIVVANPPSDRAELKRVVEEYDKRTLPENVVGAMCSYQRTFYRETSYTPRNYVEANTGFLEHDRFEDHEKDVIVVVRWKGGHDSAKYEFYEDGEPVE